MKRLHLLILISFCLIFNSLTLSAKKGEIKLRLYRGTPFIYLITQESTIKENPLDEPMLKQKTSLKVKHEVKEILGNGDAVMEASIVSFGLQLNYNGKASSYHSDTVNVRNPYYKSLNFLSQIKLSYTVSPNGEVSKLTGFESIKKKMEEDSQLSGLLRSFGSEQFILEFFNFIPQKAVESGDKWIRSGILPDMMNLKYDIQYSLKEITEKDIKLTRQAYFKTTTATTKPDGTEGEIKQRGTQKGSMTVDTKAHMLVSSETDQQLELFLPGKEKKADEKAVPIKITTHTKVERVKK
ncbi:MAG TPA: DUF6263 family protein [Prolixibacteraceae bacterium]|nr:DUF6263 family protein [Prolixibacteraceae bacterium]